MMTAVVRTTAGAPIVTTKMAAIATVLSVTDCRSYQDVLASWGVRGVAQIDYSDRDDQKSVNVGVIRTSLQARLASWSFCLAADFAVIILKLCASARSASCNLCSIAFLVADSLPPFQRACGYYFFPLITVSCCLSCTTSPFSKVSWSYAVRFSI
jgi:hypothetical protein